MRLCGTRVTLGLLAVVHLTGAYLSVPAVGALESKGLTILVPACFGALLTQVALLSIIAAWGSEATLTRWPRALFLLTFGTLASLIGSQMSDPLFQFFLVGLIFAAFAAACGTSLAAAWVMDLHLIMRSVITASPSLGTTQYSLARLAMWTAAVAVLLGLTRALPIQLSFDLGLLDLELLVESVLVAAIGGAFALLACVPLLPVVVPIAAKVLSKRQETLAASLQSATIYALIVVLAEFIFIGLVYFPAAGIFPSLAFDEIFGMSVSFNSGILLCALPTLIALRACGIRLAQPAFAN